MKLSATKEVLSDILHAHCLSTENTNKVIKLAGIPSSIYNGKRDFWRIRKMILRIVSEDKAKEIINKIPFPFIEEYNRQGSVIESWANKKLFDFRNDGHYREYWKDVLVPLPEKKGYRLYCHTQEYGITMQSR